MSVIQLPEEIGRLVEQQVAKGRAASPAEFLTEAVLRLIEDDEAEEEIIAVAQAGIADIEAGRYAVIATREDEQHLMERLATCMQAEGPATER